MMIAFLVITCLLLLLVGPSLWLLWTTYQKWGDLTRWKKSVRVAGVVGLPIAIAPVGWILLLIVSTYGLSSQKTTDPKKLSDSVQGWPYPDQVEHFPTQVSSERNPSFYYSPKVMQGWGHIYLEVDPPQSETGKLLRRAKRQSVYVVTWAGSGQRSNRVVRKNIGQYDSEDYPSPDFFGKEGESLPRENYVAYYYGAENKSDGSGWNHGHIYGVAFHKHKRRVAYWAKRW